MAAANIYTVSRVSFHDIDMPGGHRAFRLEDIDNGRTLTFFEIDNGTTEWAVRSHDDPEPRFMSPMAASDLALAADRYGIDRDLLPQVVMLDEAA